MAPITAGGFLHQPAPLHAFCGNQCVGGTRKRSPALWPSLPMDIPGTQDRHRVMVKDAVQGLGSRHIKGNKMEQRCPLHLQHGQELRCRLNRSSNTCTVTRHSGQPRSRKNYSRSPGTPVHLFLWITCRSGKLLFFLPDTGSASVRRVGACANVRPVQRHRGM